MLPNAIICVAKWIMLSLARVGETGHRNKALTQHTVVNVVVHSFSFDVGIVPPQQIYSCIPPTVLSYLIFCVTEAGGHSNKCLFPGFIDLSLFMVISACRSYINKASRQEISPTLEIVASNLIM